ncbi:MAG TPA: agmatine deiminase family protein [Candidatus Acidoferrales bacterium]|nr:agmatine deiminase family protein [Candidatus Acidoferrales bacterium]
MPAEWEPHAATWLGWPHNPTDWPGKLPVIQWVYAEICRKLAPGEKLHILVNSARHKAAARRVLAAAGVPGEGVRFFHFPTNRGWTRDTGPIFVRCTPNDGRPDSGLAIVGFRFNAWAKYSDWRRDAQIAVRAARALRVPIQPAAVGGRGFVLEGGSIDVNGRGTLLTTEECLLDSKVQVRNPGLTRAEIEAALRHFLGVRNILWLGRGIAGDDTHGHVDDFCRFVNPRTVVLARETDHRDPNHRVLEENRERLEGMRLESGGRLEVVRLPMPAPVYFDRLRLPASYANFYIGNAAVLVPTFNDPKDRIALGTLTDVFPDRTVVGIHAVDLVLGLGTLHCLTQQQPAD